MKKKKNKINKMKSKKINYYIDQIRKKKCLENQKNKEFKKEI